jgi:hypothetical protein
VVSLRVADNCPTSPSIQCPPLAPARSRCAFRFPYQASAAVLASRVEKKLDQRLHKYVFRKILSIKIIMLEHFKSETRINLKYTSGESRKGGKK